MICRTSWAEMSFSASGPTGSRLAAMRSRAREKTSAATPAACGVDEEVPLAVPVYAASFGSAPLSPIDAPGTSDGATTSRCAP